MKILNILSFFTLLFLFTGCQKKENENLKQELEQTKQELEETKELIISMRNIFKQMGNIEQNHVETQEQTTNTNRL